MKHLIAIFHYGRTVGDEDYRMPVLSEQIGKEQAFRFRIEGTRGLIKYHYAPLAQQGACYGYALSLSLAESASCL